MASAALLPALALLSVLPQERLLPLAAGPADPVFTTYAAPLSRSRYLVDEGWHLRFYDATKPLALTSDSAGEWGVGFELDGVVAYRTGDYARRPEIRQSFASLSRFAFEPFHQVAVDATFTAYSSRESLLALVMRNESDRPKKLRVFAFALAPGPRFSSASLTEAGDGLVFGHQEPPGAVSESPPPEYDGVLRDLLLLDRNACSFGGYPGGESDMKDRKNFLSVDRPGAAQSELRLAMLAPPRSTTAYHVLEVLNTVLGGGFSGRLNLNLREEKGYTYGAFSSIRYGTVQSVLLGSAPVESSVTREAILEMLKEFEDLHQWRRPVTADELRDAKENLVRGFAQRFATLSQIAGEIAELEGFGRTPGELRDYTDAVESVTLGALEGAARRYLDTAKSILVVVGDKAKVGEGLLSLDLGPVVRLDADGDPM